MERVTMMRCSSRHVSDGRWWIAVALLAAANCVVMWVRETYADGCTNLNCCECDGFTLWNGGNPLPGNCTSYMPDTCFGTSYAYNNNLSGNCILHQTARTLKEVCNLDSIDCSDNSADGTYCCTAGYECQNPFNVDRQFCADQNGIGVNGSWNQGEGQG